MSHYGLVFRKDAESGKSGYYLFNSHGDDVSKVVDSRSGRVLNQYEYDIWGNPKKDRIQKEEMSNPFRYSGEMLDEETGMYYLRARYYDPSVGRFISEDTYKGQVDNPLTLNRYTYVHNNPVNNIDPTGNWCESADGRWSHSGGCNDGVEGKLRFDGPGYSNDSDHNGHLIKENGKKIDVYEFDNSNDGVSDPLAWMDNPYVQGVSIALGMFNGSGEYQLAGKLVQFKDSSTFALKYQKHVVGRLEFGSIISEAEYLKRANNMFTHFTHAATRLRDKSTVFLNEATNEILFLKDGVIQSYYKVDMKNLTNHGFETLMEYFKTVIK